MEPLLSHGDAAVDVLSAHRRRVTLMTEALQTLFGLHQRLYDLRSESWALQSAGDVGRAEALREVRGRIDAVEDDILRTRDKLRHPERLAEVALPPGGQGGEPPG